MNNKDNKAAFGIYRSRREVSSAVKKLASEGFDKSDLLILVPPVEKRPDLPQQQRNLIRTGSVIGGIIGSIIMFLFSWLSVSQILHIPGFANLLLLWSPALILLFGTLFGLCIGAGSGALIGIGTPEPLAKRYESYINDGALLLSVHVHDARDAVKAQETLKKTGANEINILNENESWRAVYDKVLENQIQKEDYNGPSNK